MDKTNGNNLQLACDRQLRQLPDSLYGRSSSGRKTIYGRALRETIIAYGIESGGHLEGLVVSKRLFNHGKAFDMAFLHQLWLCLIFIILSGSLSYFLI
jgi:hypothetical protein